MFKKRSFKSRGKKRGKKRYGKKSKTRSLPKYGSSRGGIRL
ncbi:MAG: hypothetical protein [Arizlama microvirus]|nr:MAG: hypothetical protein [Arizlama microvirus]